MPKGKSQYHGLRNNSDRLVLEKLLQILDGRNIQTGTQTGTMIGTAANQKVGFYGKTPIAQSGAISAPSGGATIDAQARSAIVSIIAVLVNSGLIA